jgi:hypothetical protein
MQNAARKWAAENKKDIDPSQEPANYKNRAREYLMKVDFFDTDNFINEVIFDEYGNRLNKLKQSFREYLEREGLAGQNFIPRKEALTPREQKNIRHTAEGVRIEWMDYPADNNINIPNKPNQNGEYVIEIKTSSISEIQ